MYAIVDIETTGSYAAGNRITEIAIVILHNGIIIDRFESLINPQQPIPSFIQTLTGITEKMVEDAPVFGELATKIFSLLHNKVFVAHNVNFDYSFVRSMLADHGHELNSRKLCTVQLSRRLLPGLPSYKLGRLCASLGISNNARHRAAGDAEATTILFQQLILEDKEGQITGLLKENRAATRFPPHVPYEQFLALPTSPGVYYFHDQKGKVVYVGKAKNLKSRVNGHFSSGLTSRQKQNFISRIHSFTYERCGTELMAAIFEDAEIKRLWPEFNKAQKSRQQQFGLYLFEDQNGYQRLGIETIRKSFPPVLSFFSLAEGYAALVKLAQQFHLCPKLCFIQRNNSPCAGFEKGTCLGACQKIELPSRYNERLMNALNAVRTQESYAIFDKGIEVDQQSCILVVQGKFYGMGYLPTTEELPQTLDTLKSYVKLMPESSFSKRLIQKFSESAPASVTWFK